MIEIQRNPKDIKITNKKKSYDNCPLLGAFGK